jgi:hypothetical protein
MNPIRSRSLGLVAEDDELALTRDATVAAAVAAAEALMNVRRETSDKSMTNCPRKVQWLEMNLTVDGGRQVRPSIMHGSPIGGKLPGPPSDIHNLPGIVVGTLRVL